MARKKTKDDQDQAQNQGDIFDEDEDGGPPTLRPADDRTADEKRLDEEFINRVQDSPVASQDAPGGVPTQVVDKTPNEDTKDATQPVPVDPNRVPSEKESLANQAVLDKKGDLAPVQSQSPTPIPQQQESTQSEGEKKYRVTRGVVGGFKVGQELTLKQLRIKEAHLPRLLDEGVLSEVQS
jgi:hypothetical protein